MYKIIKKIIIVVFIFCLSFGTIGCFDTPYTELEEKCRGSWLITEFSILNNSTLKSISYSNISQSGGSELECIVREIGDLYVGSILNLNGKKNNDEISGTYVKDDKVENISWYSAENSLKICFSSFYLKAIVKNSISISNINVVICLTSEDKIILGCRGTSYSNYYTLIKQTEV